MRQILTLLLVFCWFFVGATIFTVTGDGGNWNDPTTWDQNAVPTSNDDIVFNDDGVTDQTLTLNITPVTIKSLTYTGDYRRTTLNGTGVINLTENSYWTGGIISESVELKVPSGKTLALDADSDSSNRKVLESSAKITNDGTMTWGGNGIFFYGTAWIENNNQFTNNTSANRLFSESYSSSLAFQNDGTFTCATGVTDDFSVTINFQNNGILNINSGFMQFVNQISNSGTINLNSTVATNHKLTNYTGSGTVNFGVNATLEFDDVSTVGTITGSSGTIAFVDKPSPNGSTITISQIIPSGIALDFTDARTVTVNVNQPLNNDASFSLSNTVLNGSGKLTIQSGKTLTWEQGSIDESVTLEVGADGNLSLLTGNAKKILNNAKLSIAANGTADLSAGSLELNGSAATVVNNGTFNIDGDAANIAYAGSIPTITNNNILRKISGTGGTGAHQIEPNVTNTGTIAIETSGVLDFLQNVTNSGTLKGIGTMSFSGSQPALGGTIAPGLSPGTLTFSGNRTISGTLNIEVNGSSVDMLVVTGNVSLSGASLVISEISPLTEGSFFTILRSQSGSISGTFSGTLPSGYSINYTSTEVRILNGILPIELTSFTGETTETSNRLHWETASETNTEWHIVERSVDGNDWEEIGRVAAAGTTQQSHRYALEDPFPYPFSYYRLRSLDLDGSFQFSKVIALERIDDQKLFLKAYPNPASSTLQVDFFMQDEEDAELLLANQFGRILFDEKIHAGQGLNSNELIVSDLPAGIYFVEVKTDHSLSVQKFVKQ